MGCSWELDNPFAMSHVVHLGPHRHWDGEGESSSRDEYHRLVAVTFK